jgi:predicted  nucleic acid-binding Zn-ribbon protein
VDHDSPLIREVTSSLTAAQTSVTDLREQLVTFNESIANAQAQLQASVDDLRKKKKDDDADRVDLKVKMRGLEENKRQAEGTRREAEKKLKAAESIRDAILGRIEKMKREIAGFKHELEDSNTAIQTHQIETDQHDRTARKEMQECQREIDELEETVAEDAHLNAELAAQVAEAVDALQSLIDHSPQNPAQGYNREEHEEMAGRGSNPVTPDVAQFPQHRLPSSVPAPFANNYRDPYQQLYQYPSNQPQRPLTQATASIMRDSAQYRNTTATSLPTPAFRDLTGFEGFGPLGAPSQAECEPEDPGSPLGNMSSSFTANLLPQELFRSLEGDQTPAQDKLDLDNPWDLTVEPMESRVAEDKWALPTPKAVSPAHEHPPVISQDPSPEEARNSPALDPGKLSRAIQDMSDDARNDGPRRWCSSSKLSALDASSPFSGYAVGKDRHSTLGFPLAQTTSNESLPLPNAGYSNAFAPSAAEKKTLRWSSLGKWGGNLQGRQETPFATQSPFQPIEGGSVGRSISAEHNAKYAWEHAVVEKEEPDGAEKKPYRFFSLGRRGKEGESAEQGSSIWKS